MSEQRVESVAVQMVDTNGHSSRGSLFGGELVVADDSPMWVAWEAAKRAWLESKARRSLRGNTVRVYGTAVAQFFEWAGVRPWEVSPGLAQEWANYMASDEYVRPSGECKALSDSSINQKLAALSSLYDFVQRRYTFRGPDGRDVSLWPADRMNPFDTVERIQVSPYGRSKKPTVEELQRILKAINTDHIRGKRDFALIYTAATTCRRFSEFINLRWGDLQEMDDGNFWFPYIYKGGRERKAVLNRMAYQAICAYLAADGRLETIQDDEYIFIALDPERILRMRPELAVVENQPLSNYTANNLLKKYARRAGVEKEKAHVHGLRHAGLKLRVEQMKKQRGGVDYVEVMELAGHSSLAVTQIYVQEELEDPEDPGGDAAARALMPVRRKGKKKELVSQAQLL